MNVCKEIAHNLKNQNVLILEKSAIQNNIQGSDPEKRINEDGVSAFIMNKGHQAIRETMLFPGEKCFDLTNPYIEFCLKPNGSKDSDLEARTFEKIYDGNDSSCGGEEGKQAMPLRIIKNQSDVFEVSLSNGIDGKASNTCEESIKLIQKNQQLMTDGETASKKRKHEDGQIDAFVMEECVSTGKKIQFKTENEFCMRNPYIEFILKSEDSNSHLYGTGNSEELYANNLALGRVGKRNDKTKRCNKNGVDIFGKQLLTSKDRNKFKVICPHCMKQVTAAGFVRHLSYCMKVRVRKSARRS